MANLRTLESELADVALGRELPARLEGDRQAVYRRLIQANLDHVIAGLLPRTAARGGARFWDEVRAFYEERGPQTHYLRDVPSELLAWARERWERDATLPAYLHDLGRHEIAAMEVSSMEGDEVRAAKGEISLEAPVVFSEATQLRRYRYAVHELSIEVEDRAAPEEREVALLVYRDGEHELRYLELTRAAAGILERLLAGGNVGAAITEGAGSLGVIVDTAFLEGVSTLLADLAERGVLLGGA